MPTLQHINHTGQCGYRYSVSCSADYLLLIETQTWRMRPHLVYVKNSEATKETKMFTVRE